MRLNREPFQCTSGSFQRQRRSAEIEQTAFPGHLLFFPVAAQERGSAGSSVEVGQTESWSSEPAALDERSRGRARAWFGLIRFGSYPRETPFRSCQGTVPILLRRGSGLVLLKRGAGPPEAWVWETSSARPLMTVSAAAAGVGVEVGEGAESEGVGCIFQLQVRLALLLPAAAAAGVRLLA